MSTSCFLGPLSTHIFCSLGFMCFSYLFDKFLLHWDMLLESKGMFRKCGLKSSGYGLIDQMYHEISALSYSVLFARYEVLQIPTPRGTLTIAQNNKSLILNRNPKCMNQCKSLFFISQLSIALLKWQNKD